MRVFRAAHVMMTAVAVPSWALSLPPANDVSGVTLNFGGEYSIGDAIAFGEKARRGAPSGSIVDLYLKQAKGKPKQWDVLLEVVNTFDCPRSADVAIHLRVGNVVENDVRPVDKLLEQPLLAEGHALSKQIYVRPLSYHHLAQKVYGHINVSSVLFVVGGHEAISTKKSKEYIGKLAKSWKEAGFKVEVQSSSADVDFVCLTRAKHFLPGGGGYSSKVSYLRIMMGMAEHDFPFASFGLAKTVEVYKLLEACMNDTSVCETHKGGFRSEFSVEGM